MYISKYKSVDSFQFSGHILNINNFFCEAVNKFYYRLSSYLNFFPYTKKDNITSIYISKINWYAYV